MHTAVASATGMYLTLFTTAAATINVLINQKLNLEYAGWICLLTLIGSLPGIYGQGWIVAKAKGRTQFTVAILFGYLVFQLVTVLPLSIDEAIRAKNNGVDIMAFKNYCQ